VPRQLIRGVTERIDRDGDVIVALSEREVIEAIEELLAAGVEAIAVSLLWSFVNDAHERRIKELMAERAPDIFTAYSHEVAPVLGEYERTATTAITAYVGPKVVGYLEQLQARLREEGLAHPLLVMQASGGLTSVNDAAQRPIVTLDSGPTGGILGCSTSAPLRRVQRDLHRRRWHLLRRRSDPARRGAARGRAGRRPVQPEDAEGAGQLDRLRGRLDRLARRGRAAARRAPERRVAPRPRLLRRRRRRGDRHRRRPRARLPGPDNFLGGRMALDRDLALRALAKLGAELGMEAEEVAVGVFRIINSQMADLIRKSTIEQGHDPRECVLVAYGGAGPTHAVFYGHDIGVRAILVLADSTVFSAEGMLTCDVTHTAEASRVIGTPFTPESLRR